MIGVILTLIAIVLFALAPTYPLILLANALWAVGFTFDSGAALALLYDSCGRSGVRQSTRDCGAAWQW